MLVVGGKLGGRKASIGRRSKIKMQLNFLSNADCCLAP